jgi:hypothetical protein
VKLPSGAELGKNKLQLFFKQIQICYKNASICRSFRNLTKPLFDVGSYTIMQDKARPYRIMQDHAESYRIIPAGLSWTGSCSALLNDGRH